MGNFVVYTGGCLLEDRLENARWRRILNLSLLGMSFIALMGSAFLVILGAKYLTIKPLGAKSNQVFAKAKPYKMQSLEEWIKRPVRDCYIPLPAVEKEVKFYECNDRPDIGLGEKNIFLGLTHSLDRKAVSEGEKVYVGYNESNDFIFSETQTPYELEFTCLKNGALEAILRAQFVGNEEGGIKSRERKFVLERAGDGKENGILPIVENLGKGVKILAPDRLLELYGGLAFEEEKGCYRFLCGDNFKTVHQIHAGDYLVWSEGVWLKGDKETKGKPLLYIKALTKQRLDYQLWDEKGSVSKSGFLLVAGPQVSPGQTNELFRGVQYRTENSVICQLGMKNVILRSGDWIVKTKSGWKNIQSIDEMKTLLSYGMGGDLFIFDGVIEKDGKKIFKGHYFDADRLTAQVVELPLKEKKDRKNSKKGVDSSTIGTPIKGSHRKK